MLLSSLEDPAPSRIQTALSFSAVYICSDIYFGYYTSGEAFTPLSCILCSVKFSINSAHLVCPVVCLKTAKNSEL